MMQQHSTELFSCWFETSKCQSVSVSSLETVCLTTVKCQIKSSKCPQEHVNSRWG